MSSAISRRLTALARASLSPGQQQRRQALRLNERTATTLSAQDAGERSRQGPANPHRSLETSNFKSSKTASLNSPEIPIPRKPETHSLYTTRTTYDCVQETHLKHGTNVSLANPDSMASPLEKDLPMPDAASANAGVMNQTPPKDPSDAISQRLQSDNLKQHNSTSLAQGYHVRKARIHATLWHQELMKQAGDVEGNADLSTNTLESTSKSRNGKDTFGLDVNKRVPEDWETFDPPEGEFYDEIPAKEEALMFEEFEKRRERNRIQIASFVKQHLYGRRRPVDGWKYIINNFGTDNNKAAKGSALGARPTTGNDLEKLALKRESSRLRRKA